MGVVITCICVSREQLTDVILRGQHKRSTASRTHIHHMIIYLVLYSSTRVPLVEGRYLHMQQPRVPGIRTPRSSCSARHSGGLQINCNLLRSSLTA